MVGKLEELYLGAKKALGKGIKGKEELLEKEEKIDRDTFFDFSCE